MTSPPTRRSGPKAAPQTPAKKSNTDDTTTAPPADPTYDDEAPELEGYTSDPLTADEWSAVCLAESRDIALSEVAP